MAVSVHKRYEIVFLSNYLMGSKLSHAAVAKAVHCTKSTVKCWLKRWTQTEEWKDSTCSVRNHATTSKQDQRIVSTVEEETFITARDIANNLNRK